MSEFSAFLFARPSFIEGASRILDFGNCLFEYNRSESGEQADLLALRADLMAIAEDFYRSLPPDARIKQGRGK